MKELLKYGRENAIKSSDLCELLNVDRRTFYTLVHKERKAGAVIIGDNRGYYLPQNREEVVAYLHRAEARAKNDLAATKAARQWLKQYEGQSALFPAKKTTADTPADQIKENP